MRKPRKQNHPGERFGMLTLMSKDFLGFNGRPRWQCRCDCGNTCTPSQEGLRSGNSTSCGCKQKEFAKKQIRRVNLSNLKKAGEASYTTLYKRYRAEAKSRELVFELTLDQFKIIVSKNCQYCDEVPKIFNCYHKKNLLYLTRETIERATILANGVDRANSKIGYTLENSVPCCYMCNIMKWDHELDRFLKHIKKIIDYQDTKLNVNKDKPK